MNGRGQSPQDRISKQASTKPYTEDPVGGSGGGGLVWSRVVVVWTKRMVRGLSEDGQQTEKGDYRHAPVCPHRSSGAGDRSPAGGLTAINRQRVYRPRFLVAPMT